MISGTKNGKTRLYHRMIYKKYKNTMHGYYMLYEKLPQIEALNYNGVRAFYVVVTVKKIVHAANLKSSITNKIYASTIHHYEDHVYHV